jgi:putative ribosome biogenesis GTPase RsgA
MQLLSENIEMSRSNSEKKIFIVLGDAGSGKTSLINTFAGENLGKVGVEDG